MNTDSGEKSMMIDINCHEDIVAARQMVREIGKNMGFTLINQTKIVTAVSELARNIIVHAKRGRMSVSIKKNGREGITAVFEDDGPGITDIQKVMEEGCGSADSPGLGLKGAKRLSDEFSIHSAPGKGTTVEISKWL